MSEYTSYSSTGMSGGALESVRDILKTRGIPFHDAQVWSTARKRAEKLAHALQKEIEAITGDSCLSSLPEAKREITRSRAMLSAFSKVTEFKIFAEHSKRTQLDMLWKEIDILSSSIEKAGRDHSIMSAARQAQERIEQFASEIQKDLCQIEREALTDTVSKALGNLGYLVEIRGSALRGTLAQTCVWTEVNPYGELSIDVSGFSGLSCLKEISRIEDSLKAHGLVIRRGHSNPHGRPDGGTLVRRLKPLFPEFKRIDQSVSYNKSRARTRSPSKSQKEIMDR